MHPTVETVVIMTGTSEYEFVGEIKTTVRFQMNQQWE
jgi:hypothetical protein